MSKDIQTIRQLQTSYSKLQNSLDAAYKNNQQLVSQVASKTADCQQLRAQVPELEVKIAELSHESSDIRLPASPASSTTSSSSSSLTLPSSTPSTPPSPVVSPHRDNVSKSRSGTLVIGDLLLRDIDGKQIRGVRVICKRGGYIADVKDLLLAQNKQYHHLILHVGTNDADLSLETSDVLGEFRPLLEAAVARADVVSVSALWPCLDGTRVRTMVEAVNVGLEQLTEGLDCQFISHDGNFRHQDNTISETMFDNDGLHLSRYGTMKVMINLGLKYQESTHSTNDQQRERPKPQNQPRDRGVDNQRKRQALHHHSRHSTQQSQPRRPLRVRDSGPIQDSQKHHTNVPSQQHTSRHEHWQRGDYNQNRFLNRPRQYTLQAKQQEVYDTRPLKLSQTSNHSHHVSCYHCGESSHDSEQCRFTSRVRCFRCHSLGHKERQCSR